MASQISRFTAFNAGILVVNLYILQKVSKQQEEVATQRARFEAQREGYRYQHMAQRALLRRDMQERLRKNNETLRTYEGGPLYEHAERLTEAANEWLDRVYLVVSHDVSTGEDKVTSLSSYQERDGGSEQGTAGDKASVSSTL